MKISSLTTGFALLTSLLLSSCSLSATSSTDVSLVSNDEAATVKKTVKIGDFNSIDVSRGIKVIFVQGPNNGIASIATTPSAEKYLRVEVKYNKLKVYYSNEIGTKRINGPTIIKVSSPQLNEVDLSSAAQLKVDGNLVTKRDFFIELSSASSFEVGSLSCLNFDVE
ncbi:MAG: DUF2807 domain-containing protein, partial [Muribaculaceae bacterium]|nr:DUF2807 domain-containing protein [Muribaculaceae bacterium]